MSIPIVDPSLSCLVLRLRNLSKWIFLKRGEDVKRETRRACACDLDARRNRVVSWHSTEWNECTASIFSE